MTGERSRIVRFAIVGVAATAVHFMVLSLLVEGFGLRPVGLANGLAAIVGIVVSYAGNHGFVFASGEAHRRAAPRFLLTYALIAMLHGGLMAAWADWAGWNYRIGFVVITGFTALCTYVLNRTFVFAGQRGGTTT